MTLTCFGVNYCNMNSSDVSTAVENGLRNPFEICGGVLDDIFLFHITLAHHLCLFRISYFIQESDVKTKPYPREIMAWTQNIYGPVFSKVLKKSKSHKQFNLREHDYVLGDHKIGGNAQSISKNRFVHHTSFLWDFLPQRMEYLKQPNKQPEYRENRTHLDFLTKIKDNVDCERGAFESAIVDSLKLTFDVDTVDFDQFVRIAGEVTKQCVVEGKKAENLTRTVFLDKIAELQKIDNATGASRC